MAVTNLTGYIWVANEALSGIPDQDNTFKINFISNGTVFDTLSTARTVEADVEVSSMSYSQQATMYSVDAWHYRNPSNPSEENGWSDPAYKKIEILGGADAENELLINFFETGGTLTDKSIIKCIDKIRTKGLDYPIRDSRFVTDITAEDSGKYIGVNEAGNLVPKKVDAIEWGFF